MGRICHMKRIWMTLAAAVAVAGPFGVSALAGDTGSTGPVASVDAADTTLVDGSVATTAVIVDSSAPQPTSDGTSTSDPADTTVTDPAAVDTTSPTGTSTPADPPASSTPAIEPSSASDDTTAEVPVAEPAVEVIAEPHVTITDTPTSTLPPFDPPPVDTPVSEVLAEPEQGWPVVPIVFPVAGPVVYWDGWGQCREVDCSRLHIGVDIVGERLQPILAAEDGVITGIVENHRTAGWGLRLDGASGWQYRYYHLNNDTPGTDDGLVPAEWVLAPGVGLDSKVVAGQVIGWMGDSGNAETSAPHLHFEIRRPETQEPINPFPSVKAAEDAAQCSPMHADLNGSSRYEQMVANDTAGVHGVTVAGASYVLFNDKVYALSDTSLNVGRRTKMVPCRWDYRFAEDLVTLETKPDFAPTDGLNAFGTTEPFVLLLPGIAL